MNRIGLLAAALAAVSLAAGATAQPPQLKVLIGTSANYEQSLKCYQYYDVAEQVANARAGKADANSDAQKKLQDTANVDKYLKIVWNKHVEDTKGSKSNKKVDDDLASLGAPIIADANASLSGDKAATTRYEAVQSKCKTFEKVEETGG
jgi:hypothetical protein